MANKSDVKYSLGLITGLGLCETAIFHAYVTSFLYTQSPAGYMGELSFSIAGTTFYVIASASLILLAKKSTVSIRPEIPGALLLLGYLIGFFSDSLAPNPTTPIILGAAYGLGSPLFRAIWFDAFSCSRPRNGTIAFLAALLLGLAFSFFLSYLPSIASLPLLSASVIVSTVMARHNRMTNEYRSKKQPAPKRNVSASSCALLLGPILGVAVLEGIIGVLNISLFSENDYAHSLFAENSVWIIRLAVVLFFISILAVTPKRFNPLTLFKASFPFTVAGLLLLSLMGASQGPVVSSILLIGYNLVFIACMLLLIETVCAGKIHAYTAVGLYGFVTATFLLAGFALGSFLDKMRGSAEFAELTLIGFSCVYILSMALLFFSLGGKRSRSIDDKNRLSDLADSLGCSPRESEVLEYLVKGRSAAHIARALDLSEHTVRGYIKSIYAKSDVHSRQDLIDIYDEHCGKSKDDM